MKYVEFLIKKYEKLEKRQKKIFFYSVLALSSIFFMEYSIFQPIETKNHKQNELESIKTSKTEKSKERESLLNNLSFNKKADYAKQINLLNTEIDNILVEKRKEVGNKNTVNIIGDLIKNSENITLISLKNNVVEKNNENPLNIINLEIIIEGKYLDIRTLINKIKKMKILKINQIMLNKKETLVLANIKLSFFSEDGLILEVK